MTDILDKKREVIVQKNSLTAMSEGEAAANLLDLEGWHLRERCIEKAFRFRDYSETMGFVIAIAKVAEAYDHQPEMMMGYNYCKLKYITHDVDGLSERDLVAVTALPLRFTMRFSPPNAGIHTKKTASSPVNLCNAC